MNWIGGHSTGSLGYIPKRDVYTVRFSGDPVKTFKTREEASSYKRKISEEKGLTKNKYRYVNGYIEVQLQNGHIGKISKKDLELFKQCVWYANKGHKRWYMVHSGKKSKELPPQIFHRLLHPEWPEIDHINRNGLDNRRSNLRNGSQSVNVKNQSKRKDNSSGKTGVSFEKSSNCWRVQWPEDGKRKKKAFSANKYGYEGAKNLAIEFRLDIDKKLGLSNGYTNDCEDLEEEILPLPKSKEDKEVLEKTNTSGHTGVLRNGNYWVASWSIDKKRGSKSFSINIYGEEKAKELAIRKRLEMKPHRH